MESRETKTPFVGLCRTWISKINLAIKHKRTKFQNQADESLRFFNGDYDWMEQMYGIKPGPGVSVALGDDGDGGENIAAPAFQMRVNKVSEMRDLYGPALYHQNPRINVDPNDPPFIPPEAMGIVPPPQPMPGMLPGMPDPMMQQYQQLVQVQNDNKAKNEIDAKVIEYLLNYLQRENDKKTHARWCIDETITKGMGLLWTEVTKRPFDETKLVGSYFDTVDNLVIDPDASCWEDVQWVARRCTHPYWQIEREYGFPDGALKKFANFASSGEQAKGEGDGSRKTIKSQSNDLMRYWKVYSKMGMGDLLKDAPKSLKGVFDEFGDYNYIVVCEGVPFPLNLGPQLFKNDPAIMDMDGESPQQIDLPREPVIDEQTGQPVIGPDGEPETKLRSDIFQAAQWPIPYWIDGAWPFEWLAFDTVPNQTWPRSLVKKGMGYLRFIDWCMSFLAGKIRKSCQTTVAVLKAAGEDLKAELLKGVDYTVLEIEKAIGDDINKVVSFLTHPPFHGDIWRVLSEVMTMFEKSTGLTELMYGLSGRQMRSAAEAQLKQENTTIRPDDYAERTAQFMSRVAAKEAMAARWFMERQDVEPILGPVGGFYWEQRLLTTDVARVAREFNYTVLASNMRKPNNERRIELANEMIQSFGPIAQAHLSQTGDPTMVQFLIDKWGEANQCQVPTLPPPPPPQPMPPEMPGEEQAEGPTNPQEEQGEVHQGA